MVVVAGELVDVHLRVNVELLFEGTKISDDTIGGSIDFRLNSRSCMFIACGQIYAHTDQRILRHRFQHTRIQFRRSCLELHSYTRPHELL